MRSARILVLDDDPAIGELLGEMLRLLGHSVSIHLEAAEALRALQGQQFDLILCDYRMPGMQGNEFYREVYLRQPDLARRVVFLTGDILSEDTQFFVKATGNPHLLKPFRFANVRDLVQRVLDEAALDPASERKPV